MYACSTIEAREFRVRLKSQRYLIFYTVGPTAGSSARTPIHIMQFPRDCPLTLLAYLMPELLLLYINLNHLMLQLSIYHYRIDIVYFK